MQIFPPLTWLAAYESSWLRHDAIAGVTLAAYAIPVSLAYAGLAGLPPQVGIYGYLLGGLGYALLGSSRQLAVGPTSAISLMMAGAVGALAGGDPMRYAQIASLAAFAVATLCLIAWLFKLSILVRLISDSILVGFKAGAGLTIIMSQLPSLFGVAGGGHNFFDRAIRLAGQFGDVHLLALAIGVVTILVLLLGERFLPGRPVGLTVVALSILIATLFGLPSLGVAVTGSDTSSNALFGALQVQTAVRTGLDPVLLAAANSSGGVMGKMISPQNLAIAAAAVGLAGREGDILRKVFGWSLLLLLFMAVLVTLQNTALLSWMVP